MSPVKHHAILAIGGAEDKVHGKEILHTFFERSGGTAACIGIIPCASRDPVAISGRYQEIFAEMGVAETVVMDIRDRAQGGRPQLGNHRRTLHGCLYHWRRPGAPLRPTGRYSLN